MSFIWRNFYWLNKVHVHVFDGFSYLWHVVTGPTYTWPPTDPVWSALRPSHHYPHTPRVPPSIHSHPSTTSKSRTVDDCSQLGFYNEWEKLCAKDLPFEKNPTKLLRVNLLVPKTLACYSTISCFILDRYYWALLMEGVIWCVFYKTAVFQLCALTH